MKNKQKNSNGKDLKNDKPKSKFISFGGMYLDVIIRSLISIFIVIFVFAVIPFLRDTSLWIRFVLIILVMPLLNPLFSKIRVGDKLIIWYINTVKDLGKKK